MDLSYTDTTCLHEMSSRPALPDAIESDYLAAFAIANAKEYARDAEHARDPLRAVRELNQAAYLRANKQ